MSMAMKQWVEPESTKAPRCIVVPEAMPVMAWEEMWTSSGSSSTSS